jgi:succinate dehydrogenase/fumarate reductase flavoprotein subunit
MVAELAAVNSDRAVDVVVVGSGGAGCVAALAASTDCAEVLVLEKSPEIGGTTAISGAGIWIPNHPKVIDAVGETDPGTLFSYVRESVGDHVPDGLIETFLETGPTVVDFLETETDLEFRFTRHPECHLDAEGAEPKGRLLEPTLYDASGLGDRLEDVRESPIFSVPTTQHEINEGGGYAHFANEVDGEMVAERMANDQVALGRALISGLYEACLDRGVTFEVDARATDLAIDDGTVAGLVADVNGARTVVEADAVVVAAGGMEWDEELRSKFLRDPLIGPASPPYNEGDGIKMGMEVGAKLGNTAQAWWFPTTHAPGEAWEDGSPLYRLPVAERTLPGSIMVNERGERFVNEAASYDDIGKALHNVQTGTSNYPNLPAYIVFDNSYRQRYPITVWRVGPEDPDPEWAIRSGTLEGLAEEIDVDTEGLRETVQAFNEHARNHEDPAFGRGESEYDRTFGDERADHPNLGPVDEPPYYAIRVYPGALGTKGGLCTTEEAQVLRVNGDPIEGLYAASNGTAHVMGIGYIGGGVTIGPNVTFGYVAGRSAADEVE